MKGSTIFTGIILVLLGGFLWLTKISGDGHEVKDKTLSFVIFFLGCLILVEGLTMIGKVSKDSN